MSRTITMIMIIIIIAVKQLALLVLLVLRVFLICALAGSVSARLAWGDISQLQHVVRGAGNAEHSGTAGHAYEGTPATA